jgi:hypothetical protein
MPRMSLVGDEAVSRESSIQQANYVGFVLGAIPCEDPTSRGGLRYCFSFSLVKSKICKGRATFAGASMSFSVPLNSEHHIMRFKLMLII